MASIYWWLPPGERRCLLTTLIVPRLSQKWRTWKSVCLSDVFVCHKNLPWLITSQVLKIEHSYLACRILVTIPFYWYHAMTLTFYRLQGQFCCQAGTTILRICLSILIPPFTSHRDQTICSLQDKVQTVNDEVSRMESERTDLLAKVRGAVGKSCAFTHRIWHSDKSKKMNISILTSENWEFGSTTL